jgi:hypothetical protein
MGASRNLAALPSSGVERAWASAGLRCVEGGKERVGIAFQQMRRGRACIAIQEEGLGVYRAAPASQVLRRVWDSTGFLRLTGGEEGPSIYGAAPGCIG